jgi:uncharacterized protein YbjT (DUF2867 family)
MRYAVVGASSGTGRQIVSHLAERGIGVRAISRNPLPAEGSVEPYAADVTNPAQLAKALDGPFDAVFYTVDIHGRGHKREAVREVMYQGCMNTIEAAAAGGAKRFVLLSVIAPDRFSWVWWVLNAMKPGMRRNILDREQALKASGLGYVICRAARLNDGPTHSVPVAVTGPRHRLNMTRSIARADLARALVRAAEAAPDGTTWDVYGDARGPVATWLEPMG